MPLPQVPFYQEVSLRRRNKNLSFCWDKSKPVGEKAQKKTVSQHSRGLLQRHQPVPGCRVQPVLALWQLYSILSLTEWARPLSHGIFTFGIFGIPVCCGGKFRSFSSKLLLLISFYSWWMRMLQTINLWLVQAKCCHSWASSQHNFVGRNYTTWWERSK